MNLDEPSLCDVKETVNVLSTSSELPLFNGMLETWKWIGLDSKRLGEC